MNVAVVGAGIFGCTTAVSLKRAGHDVVLFESAHDVMLSASKVNQLRLHVGYHYPRSPETVTALRSSVDSFITRYSQAVYRPKSSHYSIPPSGSLISDTDFETFCARNGLKFKRAQCDHVSSDHASYEVDECLIDYDILKMIVKSDLTENEIDVRLLTDFSRRMTDSYDFVVNCTYSRLNELLADPDMSDYQFELCEKIVVRPPATLLNRSVVVIDGPFMCIDPVPGNLSLLGNVVHAIISTHVGKFRQDAGLIGDYLDGRVHDVRRLSRFDSFVKTGCTHIPDMSMCEYVGSMFTYRVVLPNVEKTDERPTIVRKMGDNIINVFSGKIDTCVKASEDVVRLLA